MKTEGPKNGVQAVDTLLADTEELPAGNHEISVLLSSNVQFIATLQHRNAGNTNPSLREYIFAVNSGTYDYDFPEQFILGANERVRFVLKVATGAGAGIQASISHRQAL